MPHSRGEKKGKSLAINFTPLLQNHIYTRLHHNRLHLMHDLRSRLLRDCSRFFIRSPLTHTDILLYKPSYIKERREDWTNQLIILLKCSARYKKDCSLLRQSNIYKETRGAWTPLFFLRSTVSCLSSISFLYNWKWQRFTPTTLMNSSFTVNASAQKHTDSCVSNGGGVKKKKVLVKK